MIELCYFDKLSPPIQCLTLVLLWAVAPVLTLLCFLMEAADFIVAVFEGDRFDDED